MTQHEASAREANITKIMEDGLGSLLGWSIPDILETVGPFDLLPFQEYDADRRSVITRCRTKLDDYSDEDILSIVNQGIDFPSRIFADWDRFVKRELLTLKDCPPPWYAAGFGHPEHVADFNYWAQCRDFSLHE